MFLERNISRYCIKLSKYKDLMLQTLVNLGVCYYKIGLLEESLICFENCLVTLRNNK